MKIITLTNSGQSQSSVDLGFLLVSLTARYSYLAECWMLDIVDVQGESLLLGLMLVPGVDLFTPYTQLKKTLGSLVVVEKRAGDYKSPNALGENVKLLWFAPDEEVVIPT